MDYHDEIATNYRDVEIVFSSANENIILMLQNVAVNIYNIYDKYNDCIIIIYHYY